MNYTSDCPSACSFTVIFKLRGVSYLPKIALKKSLMSLAFYTILFYCGENSGLRILLVESVAVINCVDLLMLRNVLVAVLHSEFSSQLTHLFIDSLLSI